MADLFSLVKAETPYVIIYMLTGKKNGLGFQYEAENKKTFEGEWSNGEWKQSGTAYNSFLKNPGFSGEQNETHVLAGVFDSKSKRLSDTGYYYQIKEKKRYSEHIKKDSF
jgi:hypothetical protein